MAYIIETPNAFQPLTDVRKHQHDGGISIRGWLEKQYPGFIEFETPTICVVNGKAFMRSEWGYTIQPRDVINFVVVPGDPFTWVAIAIAVVAIAITLVLPVPKPVTPGEVPASDPVFTLQGQQNEIRLGQPIEVVYGRNRIYPSYASRPYFQYIDNDQFQFSLFCLGHGEFDITTIQISDTPIAQYSEVEFEVIPPGHPVNLFPTNVYTSPEAGGQTLFAPNEDEYIAPGWVGPFVANPSGTETTKIEIDLIFPRGLYVVSDDGNVNPRTINIECEVQEIDDAGATVGAFFAISFSPIAVTAATTTPQRRTFSSPISPGRYQMRLRRTNDKDMSTRSGHEVVWEGLRTFLNTTHFGNKTLIAVKIRATNNLNDRTQARFNVIATRKLTKRDKTAAPVPTRSIIWAFVDAFRNSKYGAGIQDDIFFDWAALTALDNVFTERGDYFDWIFRDSITIWEAAQTIARVGRAVPLLVGSLITMKRDGPLEVPVTFFNPDNMIKGSVDYQVKLWDLNEYDSVEIEYTEPITGYKQEQVVAVLPDGTADNPQSIRLAGCQSRAQAYREGLYLMATQIYLREMLTFDTGLEGLIPQYGDLIAVALDITRWGRGRGYVVQAELLSDGDTLLWLSEPLDWAAESEVESLGDHQIILRGSKGQVLGPFTTIRTEDDQQVIIHPDEGIDFLTGGDTEPMLFIFGLSGQITQYFKVTRIEPQGTDSVRITCVNDSAIIHSYDSLTPPELNTEIAAPPIIPDLPTIAALHLSQMEGSLLVIQAAWTSAYGARYYVVQSSEDGENWQERGVTTRTAIQFQVHAGPLWVRVAAVNSGQGPWVTETLSIALLMSLELSGVWTDLEWSVRWWEVLGALSYRVEVFDHENSTPVSKRVESISVRDYTYDYIKAILDANIVRHMLVEVDPVFENGPSNTPASLELTNSVPLPPTSPGHTTESVESDGVLYRLSWTVPHEGDLIRVKVWVHDVAGFDPNIISPIADETISAPGWAGMPSTTLFLVPFDSGGGHPAQYWRVALFDVWGNEILTNITAEQIIAAYP